MTTVERECLPFLARLEPTRAHFSCSIRTSRLRRPGVPSRRLPRPSRARMMPSAPGCKTLPGHSKQSSGWRTAAVCYIRSLFRGPRAGPNMRFQDGDPRYGLDSPHMLPYVMVISRATLPQGRYASLGDDLVTFSYQTTSPTEIMLPWIGFALFSTDAVSLLDGAAFSSDARPNNCRSKPKGIVSHSHGRS